MTQQEILDLDKKYLWHPYAPAFDAPRVLPVKEAKGSEITLCDGTKLVDGVSSWWCVCHGHNPPEVVEAIKKQSDKFAQVMFAGFTHEPAVELSQKLLAKAPKNLEKVFFVDSGSVSVECAVKIALQYQIANNRPSRKKLATVLGGYHGDTAIAMSLSDPSGMHKMFQGIIVENFFAPRPESCFGEEYNSSSFEKMAKLLESKQDEIAAVIIEPIFQGANGMRFYHPDYLKELRKKCDELDILLILDEVATGFGRLGKFFASEFAGINPDMMCVGKALTAGAIPFAAILISRDVAEKISNFGDGKLMHGPTFMANPIACAAACASLELFDKYDWQTNVKNIEIQLKNELLELKNSPNVIDVRILGAVGAIELKNSPNVNKLYEILFKHNVWLRPFGNFIYTMPPFILTTEELSRITTAMREIAEITS